MNQNLSFLLLALGFALVAADSSVDTAAQVYHISTKIDALTRDYEIAATSGNLDKLDAVLTTSKTLAFNISSIQYDLKQALASVNNYHEHAFHHRLNQEFELIEINSKARQLKIVQQEILGIKAGVSHVPNYQNSEKLALTLSFIGDQFIGSFAKLADVDALLEEVRKKNQTHQTIDSVTKGKIIKLLKDFKTGAETLKKDIEIEYYSVVENMRLRGEELSVVTRIEIENGIDGVNFCIKFVNDLLEAAEKFGEGHHAARVMGLFFKV